MERPPRRRVPLPFVSSEVETRVAQRFSTSLEANGTMAWAFDWDG